MIYNNTVSDIESSALEPWRMCGEYKDGFTVMFGFGLQGDGRLVKSDGKLYWMKKYAKNRGYLMSPIDILRISWATTNMDR